MTSTRQRASSGATSAKRQMPWLGIVFAVIAVALVAAIALGSGSDETGPEAADVTVDGKLPQFQATAGDPAVGMPAPAVSGVNFAGDTVTIANDGTAKAIAFLAHWCPHCQREVPRVQEWLDTGGGVPGVAIMSVSTGENELGTNHPASAWLEAEGWTPPVVVDSADSEAHLAYGGGGFPYWVFVDSAGRVVARTSGELDTTTLEGLMQQIAP